MGHHPRVQRNPLDVARTFGMDRSRCTVLRFDTIVHYAGDDAGAIC